MLEELWRIPQGNDRARRRLPSGVAMAVGSHLPGRSV
jgi:hypothetical protein